MNLRISLAQKNISLPSYDQCLKASHIFNVLDARGAISVAERAEYIGRIRNIVKLAAEVWIQTQKRLNLYVGVFLELFSEEIPVSLQINLRKKLLEEINNLFKIDQSNQKETFHYLLQTD